MLWHLIRLLFAFLCYLLWVISHHQYSFARIINRKNTSYDIFIIHVCYLCLCIGVSLATTTLTFVFHSTTATTTRIIVLISKPSLRNSASQKGVGIYSTPTLVFPSDGFNYCDNMQMHRHSYIDTRIEIHLHTLNNKADTNG